MIHTARAVRTLQAVAMTVGVALFLWSTGLPTIFHSAEAASITNASDTLSDSAPSNSSVHTIQFSMPNGMTSGQTFEVRFEAGFDLSALDADDISMTVDGNATTTGAAAGANNWGVATNTPTVQDITFTAPDNWGVASSGVLILTIGSTVGTMIVNPSATSSYLIEIGGGNSTAQDTGQVRVAIIDEVTVSASVDTSLTFSVAGLGIGASVNGTSTTGTSTNVSIPFGTLSAGNIYTLAQRLNVSTNAANGYTVTVEQTGPLQSTTGATIDGFIDGADTFSPAAWTSPSELVNDPDTYGHWGITSTDDATARDAEDEFAAGEWAAPSTTPIVIMGHTGPSDGSTDGVGSTTVGYQVEITALQEAGDDYTTTLRYIATPTF